MSYIICNESKYLRQDAKGFHVVNDVHKASVWKKLVNANNLVDQMKNDPLLSQYNLSVRFAEKNNGKISMPATKTELNFDILEKVKEISDFACQIEDRRLYLAEMISKADAELVDIEHAAEFYNLNAAQGYKLYKLLHDTRIQRRIYKDELEKIRLSLGTQLRSSNINNLERSILGLEARRYTPRVHKELFGV